MRFMPAAFALVLGLSLTAGFAQAGGQGHPHHGGQTRIIGTYEVELVAKGAEVTLFVLDDKDQKVDASVLSGSAEVLAKGNERKTVELKPAGDNKLAAPINFRVEGKFRATVTLRNAQGEVGKGRYAVDMSP
ncbi:MAG: adenylosuccinate synthase [Alphaproteobacteria bacterium]